MEGYNIEIIHELHSQQPIRALPLVDTSKMFSICYFGKAALPQGITLQSLATVPTAELSHFPILPSITLRYWQYEGHACKVCFQIMYLAFRLSAPDTQPVIIRPH